MIGITTSPAKSILFGEHVIVYPNYKGVISSLNLRCKTTTETIEDKNGNIQFIDINDSGFGLTISINEILVFIKQAREKYETYIKDVDLTPLFNEFDNEETIIKLVLGIACSFLEKKNIDIFSMNVNYDSKIPYSAGFGASSSFSSSIITSILLAHGVRPTIDEVYEMTFEYEKFQHGRPSGGDPSAIVYGGFIEFYKDENQVKHIRQLKIKDKNTLDLFGNLYIVHTGKAKESTGSMVAHVRALYEQNKIDVTKKFDVIKEVVESFVNDIETNTLTPDKLKNNIDTNGKILEELNIVTTDGKRVTDELRENGCAVKVSGAGGLGDGPCGNLLVYSDDKEIVEKVGKDFNLRIFDLEFGTEGIIY